MGDPPSKSAFSEEEEQEDPLVALGKGLVPAGYLRQGLEAGLGRRRAALRRLLEHRRLPEDGWDDAAIEGVLYDLAMMDSNNFPDNVGVGEREARVFSRLVRARHGYFGHGMGRSGDVQEPQPKAAGSSLLVQLTNILALDALRVAGLIRMTECAVLPLATGMAMTLALLALANQRRQELAAQGDEGEPPPTLVLWPRIDQKSCLKAILTAGLTPVPLPLRLDGDELRTDLEGLAAKLEELGGTRRVLCVLSTTSCFAPRVPDAVQDIARLCRERGVPHVVNNAYGLQCSKVTHALNEACRRGRVDLVVQSTDKNFLVPVGGAVVAGPGASTSSSVVGGEEGRERRGPGLVPQVCRMYPGRAGSAPVQDLFITLLSMGRAGYLRLLKERKALAAEMNQGLAEVAARHGERLLQTPRNTISFAMTLGGLAARDPNSSSSGEAQAPNPRDVSFLGSMLFTRCVSGTRVVVPSSSAAAAAAVAEGSKDPTAKTIGPLTFPGYGSHADAYAPGPYLTAACAIGASREEVEEFLRRLDKALGDFARRRKGRKGQSTERGKEAEAEGKAK